MVPFDLAAKRVIFGGHVFICRNVDEEAPRCIILEVDTKLITELVPLAPCSGARSGTVTSDGAAVDAAWGSWGWTDGCDRDLLLLARYCCNLLYELLKKDVRC